MGRMREIEIEGAVVSDVLLMSKNDSCSSVQYRI